MSREPYLASDDSALLRRAIRGRTGERFLEIGAGNAGNLCTAAGGFDLVVGTDLLRPSMSDWKKKGANFVLADGASCFREADFDLVAFNPPYLPVGEEGDITVDGGEGLEVPLHFLRDALGAVKKHGAVLMLLNNEAELEEFEEVCGRSGFLLEEVASEKLFFEELKIFEARGQGEASATRGAGEGAPMRYADTSETSFRHQVPASPS